NAFKYSPNGGTITVAARPAADWIEVTVDDEGIGIAPGDLERIFERFVQGETGDRRRFGGIGLGLYIVRQLARAQDGEVAAASRPGGGTRMSLQLRSAGVAPGRRLARRHGSFPGQYGKPPLTSTVYPPLLSTGNFLDSSLLFSDHRKQGRRK